MNVGRQQRFVWWLKLALGIAALGTLAWTIQPTQLLRAFAGARIPALAAAALLLAPNLWFQYKKWNVLVRCMDEGIGGAAVWQSLFSGFAFGIVTPARIGEFGGRLLGDPRLQNSSALSLIALDKLAAMLATLSAGIVAFAYLAGYKGWIDGIVMIPAFIAAGLLPLCAWYLLKRIFAGNRPQSGTSPGVIRRAYERFGESVRVVPARTALAIFLYSAGFVLTFILQFALLIAAFESTNFLLAATGAACVMAAKTVVPPVTFGELGIREGFAVLFLTMLGIQSATAFNASLVLFSVNVLLPAAAGGMLLLRMSIQPRVQP